VTPKSVQETFGPKVLDDNAPAIYHDQKNVFNDFAPIFAPLFNKVSELSKESLKKFG
jgi:hypothetical protein